MTVTSLVVASWALAQTSNDPLPSPIPVSDGALSVSFVEFASLPDVDGEAAGMVLLVDEPGTGRLFVNDMSGLLYSVTYDGQTVTRYLDLTASSWTLKVRHPDRERGFQSFAFHPQFNQPGTPGFGKLYTFVDTSNRVPAPDFVAGGSEDAHDTILLEWTAETPGAATYDGGPPRELMRVEQPFWNHNGGQIGFSPVVSPGDVDFGLLYVALGDGGPGGDPFDRAQNLNSIFGKILRIDPLGSDSANRQYGLPANNPFVKDGDASTLGEIYAFGVRNPQRFGWDRKNGNMFVADIGQRIVEEISLVSSGANLGWSNWEGSFRFISREKVSLVDPRGEAGLTYPTVEYGHRDRLLRPRPTGRPRSAAVTGVVVYRQNAIPQLANLVLFGDFPSGEIFYFQADQLPEGGQASIGRILLNDQGETKTLLQLIQEKNRAQGKPPLCVRTCDSARDPTPGSSCSTSTMGQSGCSWVPTTSSKKHQPSRRPRRFLSGPPSPSPFSSSSSASFLPGARTAPTWTPDGSVITFTSQRAGGWDLYSKRVDGSGPAELLSSARPHDRTPGSWSPDGQAHVHYEIHNTRC